MSVLEQIFFFTTFNLKQAPLRIDSVKTGL